MSLGNSGYWQQGGALQAGAWGPRKPGVPQSHDAVTAPGREDVGVAGHGGHTLDGAVMRHALPDACGAFRVPQADAAARPGRVNEDEM